MDKLLLKKKIKDLFIVKENDGSYVLFGKYIIIRNNDIFQVYIDGENSNYTFYSLKNAVSWCVFEKNNKRKENQRLCELDQLISSLNVHILQYEKIVKKKVGEDRDIFISKLTEEKNRKKIAMKEINKFIEQSRYLQIGKFKENQYKII